MRRIVGLVMVALGTMLVGLAVALPSFVYPRLAVAPDKPETKIVARGDGVTALKVRAEKVEPVTGTVYVTRYVIADPQKENRPEPPDDVVQYRLGFKASLDDPEGDLLTAYLEGYTLDKVSAEANDCCADYVIREQTGEPESITHEGLGLKFPFRTEKRAYPFWDLQIKGTKDAEFVGTETLFGLETYKFVQKVEDQTIGTRELPGSLFDPAATGPAEADEVYATTRTLWVEPVTGAIIKGSETVNWRFEYQGKTLPRTIGTLTYTDDTVKAQVDEYSGPAGQLTLIRSTLPLLLWIIGPLLVLGGLVVLFLGGGAPRHREGDHEVPEPVGA